MAPNLLVKAVYVSGVENSETKVKYRTNVILEHVYSFIIKNGDKFQTMSALNSKEEEIINELKTIIEEFRFVYLSALQEMVSNININLQTLPSVMQKVSDELFCEGITWSRIVAFFVFVGELTLKHIENDESGDVDKIYECFRKHVKENFMCWVEEHGGWEGVKTLSVKRNSNSEMEATTSSELSATKSSELSSAKSSDGMSIKTLATDAFQFFLKVASPVVSYT